MTSERTAAHLAARRAAFAAREAGGWLPFGAHADRSPVPLLDFDGVDEETGDPLWERVREGAAE